MSETHRYVAAKRRVREDARFIAGRGRYAADCVPRDALHIALVASPYPAARILSIDAREALALPGVVDVVTGAELAAASEPLASGIDVPKLRRYPLAVEVARYVGEWVAAVVAESRALAEDAAELVAVDYEKLPFVVDPEEALSADSPPVHSDHGSNILYRRTFVWGDVDGDFAAAADNLSFRAIWGRSATVPLETTAIVAQWQPSDAILEVWAAVQMPKFADQLARALRLPANGVCVHQDVDVGGSFGVKRGLKHAVLTGYAAQKLGRPVCLIEDRLENMRAGDGHGPERIFDCVVAFEADGRIRSLKLRALDNVGAHAGRAPLQLGKPVGAIVGPYTIGSVEYEAIAVTTNKAAQEAVRGFGQGPTNYALEIAVDKVARHLDLDLIEVRRRNLIPADAFPYLIPSGSTYDSGDYQAVLAKVLAAAKWPELVARRDALRAEGQLAGIGIATCLEPSGGNSSFEPLFNPKIETTAWLESCAVVIDAAGAVTVRIYTASSGQGHETLAATVVGEVLGIDPDAIRVVRDPSMGGLPSNSPVGSRMAIMLGGAAYEAAQKLKTKLMAIAAHALAMPLEALDYLDGAIRARAAPENSLSWADLVHIAHRAYHKLPTGMEAGLAAFHVQQVPNSQGLPTSDGRVQMYPCYSFECHLILLEIDPELGLPTILDYTFGHDCGTRINPDIVRGMSLGGIAQGLGAALFEEFSYDAQGQLTSASFLDYPLPSVMEMPEVRMVAHETPSPLTAFGQKGAGESGYLGAPAALASAINDALSPLDTELTRLPMRISSIGDAIAAAKGSL